jgi:hypothetical protein
MRTKAIRRQRAEKRPSQVGIFRRDINGSRDIPQAKANLAALAAFQILLGALSILI